MTDAQLIPTEITVNEEMNLKTAPGQDSEKQTEQSTRVPMTEVPDQDILTTDKYGTVTTQKTEIESSTEVTRQIPTTATETKNNNP